MSKYAWIAHSLRALVVLVTGAVLFAYFYPAWQHREKPAGSLLVYFGPSGGDGRADAYEWMGRHLKLEAAPQEEADLVVVRDGIAFTDTPDGGIRGKVVLFEKLFSQVAESPYRVAAVNHFTGVTYSGTFGLTVRHLDDRLVVPPVLVSRYESQSGRAWDFYGKGIVLDDGNQITVLEEGRDYFGDMFVVSGGEEIPYAGYFEITESYNPVEASFRIHLSDTGARIFKERGLPDTFPAVYRIDRNLFRGYYLSGDFGSYIVGVAAENELMPSLMKAKRLFDDETNEEFFWRWYMPWFKELVGAGEMKKQAGENLANLIPPDRKMRFSADSRQIFIDDDDGKAPFFSKGVNLGPAMPGKYFTEFPLEKETYLQWFEQIAALNVNTIRVYTLLPPVFYQALYEFNLGREEPLYLLQEIWPEEHPEGLDYLRDAYNDAYREEIEYNVHAVHGNVYIPRRDFRSYGFYNYDVSPFLIGYLVGRELEPEEVLTTDEKNRGYIFEGDYLYTRRGASPTEGWLAASCDYTLSLEDVVYGSRPLTAIVSWPTLDPLEHDSEWNAEGDKSLQYNDKAVVDINHIQLRPDKTSGFFGAYHIYPNYPNFMNNEPSFAAYEDNLGSFRYGGYLEAFMQQHRLYPALVAEYGISTSMATAHFSPDGLHHGGLTEEEQAEGIIRMTDAIRREGYAGAVIFEWMDEWAKKTWTTEPYMIPYDRRVFWHNALDPEQNYGLLALEAVRPELETIYRRAGDSGGAILSTAAGMDASYLHLEIELDHPWKQTGKSLQVEIGTAGRPPAGLRRPEFLLTLSDGGARLLANPGYNWTAGRYQSMEAGLDEYEELIQLVNPENTGKDGTFTPALSENLSTLSMGPLEGSNNLVEVDGSVIRVRLPYTLMGISDPSTGTILRDSREFIPVAADQIQKQKTGAISFRIRPATGAPVEASLTLKTWETPEYTARLKDSFAAVADYFGSIP